MAERLVVVWRVTTRCNLSCGFCAYDRRLPFERQDADEALALQLGASLASLSEQRGCPVHVSLLGGEPLLWEPLARVARDFVARGLSLGMTSNGTGLGSPALCALLLECFDELTLSLDGIGPRHDEARGWPGGYERVSSALRFFAAAKAAQGRRPRLRVNSVLMYETIDEFPRLARALAELGVEELTFNRLGGRDRPEFHALHRVTPEQLERFAAALPALRSELGLRGLSLRGAQGYVERLLELERGQPRAVLDCAPGSRFLFVDERGTLSPCSFTLDSYGEPSPQAELTLLPRRFLARQRQSRASVCDDCPSTQVFDKFGGA